MKRFDIALSTIGILIIIVIISGVFSALLGMKSPEYIVFLLVSVISLISLSIFYNKRNFDQLNKKISKLLDEKDNKEQIEK